MSTAESRSGPVGRSSESHNVHNENALAGARKSIAPGHGHAVGEVPEEDEQHHGGRYGEVPEEEDLEQDQLPAKDFDKFVVIFL